MIRLFELTKELRQKNCEADWVACQYCRNDGLENCPLVIEVLCEEYPNIPRDIIIYFIATHYRQADEIVQGFEHIDAHKFTFSQRSLSSVELLDKNIIDFALVKNDVTNRDNVRKLPQKICTQSAIDKAPIKANGKIINKDNREILKFGFQINLTAPNYIFFGRAVWRKKQLPVKILVLDNPISKFNFQNLYAISEATVLATITPQIITSSPTDANQFVEIRFSIPNEIADKVGCVAIVDGGTPDEPTGGMPYIFRNVNGLTKEEKEMSFYITP